MLIPRRISFPCGGCKCGDENDGNGLDPSGDVDSGAALLPFCPVVSSTSDGLSAELACPVGAATLSRVPKLDMLTGLVCAWLSVCVSSDKGCCMFSATMA